MKKIRILAIAALLGWAGWAGWASADASVRDLPVTTVDGNLYFYYEVQPKETIYSLTHKLGITREQIIAANPSVADGLKAHSVLYFPVTQADLDAGAGKTTHVVAKGETLYGISHRYGMTSEELIKLNPSINDGLRAGMTLVIVPAPTSVAQGTSPVADGRTYIVREGDTFYSIAHDNGLTVPELEAANPSVTVLKQGQTIVVPHSKTAKAKAAPKAPAANGNIYLVREGDTFYSIAHANGTTVAALEAANPDVTVLQAGQTIVIPSAGATVDVKAVETPSGLEGEVTTITPVSTTIEAIEPPMAQETIAEPSIGITNVEPAETRIAVMLPFMLDQNSMSRATARHLEFYKGFLLAVDSLRRSGNNLKIYAFDTANSADSVAQQLERPEMKLMQVIIAPDDEKQLDLISKFASKNKVAVFNTFVVKDTTYLHNPSMIQANIGTNAMYRKAIAGMVERLNGAIPVFLNRKGGASDKTEFIEQLQAEFKRKKIDFLTVNFDGKLKATDLDKIKNGRYVFIPQSGSAKELGNVIDALNARREKMFAEGGEMRLWGYPEWITFKGENLEGIQAMDALIYSRFGAEEGSLDASDIENKYSRWYAGEMAAGVPRQGLLGFDVGMFLINALNGNDMSLLEGYVPVYRGVQNSFVLSRSGKGAGLENQALYLVNFRPSGLVENILLQ